MTYLSKRKFVFRRCNTLKKKNEIPLKTISDLPMDLVEDVLYRLPLTSVRGFRSACKNWNTLSKGDNFIEKHLAQAKAQLASDCMVVLVINFKVCLASLHGIHNGVDPYRGKLVSLLQGFPLDISLVHHCDGLLLCITKDFKRFFVWNPYTCQTRWLNARTPHHRYDWYKFAIGYTNYGKSSSPRSHKVLRFVDNNVHPKFAEYEIYDLDTNSWRPLDIIACRWDLDFYARGMSVKGNTYWFARERFPLLLEDDLADFLICFDFTAERFGSLLHLPFHSCGEDIVVLSSVREEQLAVLYHPRHTLILDIWITTKIDPDNVLWSNFLSVDMTPLNVSQFSFPTVGFFVDQEKKAIVVFDQDTEDLDQPRNTTFIIGHDGYLKKVDLGESTSEIHNPLGCSYVPSSVQIK